MLLRLITNTRVLLLLIHVLDYYKEKSSMWNEVAHKVVGVPFYQQGYILIYDVNLIP